MDDFDRTRFVDLLGAPPMKNISFFVASMTGNSCCRLSDKNLSNDQRLCNCSSGIKLKYLITTQAAKVIATLVTTLSNGNYICNSGYSSSQMTIFQDKLNLLFRNDSAFIFNKDLSSLNFKSEMNFELVEDGLYKSIAHLDKANDGSYIKSGNNDIQR